MFQRCVFFHHQDDSSRLQDAISQKVVIFRLAAVRTWNLTFLSTERPHLTLWFMIHLPGFHGSNQQTHLAAKQEYFGEKYLWTSPTKYLFSYCRDLQRAVKSYSMEPMVLFPLRRKSWYGLLWPLKKSFVLCWVWTREPWVQWKAR
jgi:hypothetical protein